MRDHIEVRGAREHNLKNVSLNIPKNQLVVVTGPSGSGKSTLIMDTLLRECQRLYLESLGMITAESISKPKVDAIRGLSPAISVGRQAANRNPRSTVGTVTDIYTLVRILFAKAGTRSCPSCGTAIAPSPEGDVPEAEEPGRIPCPRCGQPVEKWTMAHFSFNKPEGACPACSGLGQIATLDEAAVLDENRSLRDGGVVIWQHDFVIDYQTAILKAAAEHYGFEFDERAPIKEYGQVQRDLLLYGVESEEFKRHFPEVKPPKTVRKGKFEGVITGIWRRYREKGGESSEAALFESKTCPDCRGTRLKKESRLVTLGGLSIDEVASRSVSDVRNWARAVLERLPRKQRHLTESILQEILVRTGRLVEVGLGYLSLDRPAGTLSGGEMQRLRLASVLGSGLTGVVYVLDEPTVGLHPRDTRGLIRVLRRLREEGNSLLVIEHDEEVIEAADHVIDMGPGAGSLGGEVVGQGRLADLISNPKSVTGAYFKPAGRRVNGELRNGNGRLLTIREADLRNLKGITVSFPLGCLISVTGVSGSGKSTLLFDVLAASSHKGSAVGCKEIAGWEGIGQLITVDQSPLTRMKRSNVATYTDVYTHLRKWYTGLPEARRAGLTAKHFSFNSPGGRCEKCQGLGVVPVYMHFLAEVEVRCPACRGRRFQEEVLRVRYKGHSISDVLDMTVEESLSVFGDHGAITETAELLREVGLGYLKWGQSVNTLSGGESQRIKLAKELSRKARSHALYLLDEPTTGLHPGDIRRLLVLLNKLVDAGHTVILVEHNLDVISGSDWVIDLGPEGGEAGGELVAEGTPEEVARVEASCTGRFLKEKLGI
ncbi:MAG: excinuclease ABC subunit UvrA [Planifilum fimeticola]